MRRPLFLAGCAVAVLLGLCLVAWGALLALGAGGLGGSGGAMALGVACVLAGIGLLLLGVRGYYASSAPPTRK